MTLTVLLFARVRDLIGSDRIELELPATASVVDLRGLLSSRYPTVKDLLNRCAIAVNHDFADNSHHLSEDDEIAILPPVSGG